MISGEIIEGANAHDVMTYNKIQPYIERGRTMAFFDKLGETIVNVGKDATQKAKDLSGVAKLNLDIKAKEDYVQRQYTELGRIYYEEHKTESEVDGAEHFELIKEALEEIERMKLGDHGIKRNQNLSKMRSRAC